MKKTISLVCSAVLAFSAPCLPVQAGEGGLNVVATIFPIYDWVREITAGVPGTEVTMLLDSGVDLHSYQPSADDILTIGMSDLFLYVGGESDKWVEDVLATALNPDLVSMNLVQEMGEGIKEEEIVEGMEHEHDHEDEDEHEHDEEEHEHDEHEADEHVWLSLRNASLLCQAIADRLSEMDPANAEAYQANVTAYIQKLSDLDTRYAQAVEESEYKTVLFGDRFPFRYLVDDYGLSYYASFSGCSAESEASFETILFLAQKLDELGLPAVLTIENPGTRIAETVVETSSEKDQLILSMDSLQSMTDKDVADGATYLTAMEENLTVLSQALNGAE